MIISIHHRQDYLGSIADIITSINQSNLKIILPTTASCTKLQSIIIKNSPQNSCVLPNITPIININIGSEDIYNIPSNFIEPISRLHQKVILADIIRSEDKNITISGSLDLSSHIIRLFDELIDFKINIEELEEKTISDGTSNLLYDVADHWRQRVEFLKKIHSSWSKTLASYEKIDLSTYRRNILELEISAAKNNLYPQMLVGIFPKGPLIEELVNIIASSENSYFIPPPIDISKFEEYKDIYPKAHYYYQVGRMVGLLDLKKSSLREDNTLIPREDSFLQYSIATNLRQESELITEKISSWLEEDSKAVIAIICKNNILINMCSNILENKMIGCINMNGYSLLKTKAFEFLILLIEAHDKNHRLNLEKLIILLKTHYLFSKEAREFELELRKKSTIIPIRITEEIAKAEISLRSYIDLAEKLAPAIWYSVEGKALSDFLYELLEIENIEEYISGDYIDFLKSTAAGARYHKNITTEQVVFASIEDASLCGYKYVILCDMNEGSLPSKISSDPWMNNKMRENLGLADMSERIGIEWYHFKNLLEREKIYITRSEKKNGLETSSSRFLQELISTGALYATS